MRQQTPRTPGEVARTARERGRPDGRHHGPLRAPRTRTDPCAELRFIQHQVCGVRFSAAPLPRQALWNGKVRESAAPTRISERPELRRSRSNWTRHIRIAPHCASSADRVSRRPDGRHVGMVAHRIVHGGSKYSMPVRLDANVLADQGLHSLPRCTSHSRSKPWRSCCGSSQIRHRWLADTAFHHFAPGREYPAVAFMPHGARVCVGTGFTACRMSTWQWPCPNAMATPRAGATVVATWAVAPVCAPCVDSKAWPPPWASPRLTADGHHRRA